MAVTLEKLLTHPRVFDIQLSTLQRAVCRVAEGLPLGDLACDESVIRSLGGPEAVANLPTERPKEFYLIAAIRTGKSLMCAAIALHIALTIDLAKALPNMKKSEIARISVVSLDTDKAKAVMNHLMGALERDGGLLRRFVVRHPKPNEHSVRIRREDGFVIEFVIAAGKVGGRSLVSRNTICAIFDEAARMQGREDGTVNFEDMRNGVIARLAMVSGAQLVVVSSPWAARGPVYDAVQNYHGRPSSELVLMRATGPELCPAMWPPEAVEKVRKQPDGAYQTDVLGEFVDAAADFFTVAELKTATRAAPLHMEWEPEVTYGAAIDAGFRSNSWTLVIVGKRPAIEETEESYFVAFTHQWQGSVNEPLRAKEVFADMAPMLKTYQLTSAKADRYAYDPVKEWAEFNGISLELDESSEEDKSKRWLALRTKVLAGKLELSPDPVLRLDLQNVTKVLTPAGIRFRYAHTSDGRHSDFAPAFCVAVESACQESDWGSQLTAWQRRGYS